MVEQKEYINKIGRRKSSVARIYIKEAQSPNNGKIMINGRTLEDYFPSEIFQASVSQPYLTLGCIDKFDTKVTVQGGGLRGQSEAIRLAISRALCEMTPDTKPILKKKGYLTRDPRQVERKKYGQKKARKRFQFTKR